MTRLRPRGRLPELVREFPCQIRRALRAFPRGLFAASSPTLPRRRSNPAGRREAAYFYRASRLERASRLPCCRGAAPKPARRPMSFPIGRTVFAFSRSESQAASGPTAPVSPWRRRASRRPRRPDRTPKLAQSMIYLSYSYFTSHLFNTRKNPCSNVLSLIDQLYAKRRPTRGAHIKPGKIHLSVMNVSWQRRKIFHLYQAKIHRVWPLNKNRRICLRALYLARRAAQNNLMLTSAVYVLQETEWLRNASVAFSL